MSGVELVVRHVEVDAAGRGHRLGRAGRTAGSRSKSGPDRDRPLREAERAVGDQGRGIAPCWVPKPSQTGHQPSGLLNEKWCGESSSKLRPQPSHERCWLLRSTGQRLVGVLAGLRDQDDAAAEVERRRDRVGEPDRVARRTTARSMTTSIRCFRRRLSVEARPGSATGHPPGRG